MVLGYGEASVDETNADCLIRFCYEEDARLVAQGNLFAAELALLNERHDALQTQNALAPYFL